MTDSGYRINTIPYSLEASAQSAEPNSTVSLCWFWITTTQCQGLLRVKHTLKYSLQMLWPTAHVLLKIESMSKTIKFYPLCPCLTLFKRKCTAKLARLIKMFDFIIHCSETELTGLNTTWIARFKQNKKKRMGSFKTYVGNEPPHTQGAPVATNFLF